MSRSTTLLADTFSVGYGDDSIEGGRGWDLLSENANDAAIGGRMGKDLVCGGVGDDTLNGDDWQF